MKGQFFRNRNIETRYVLEGDGPMLTFIHGVGSSLDAWDDVVKDLRGRFRILRYDLRGFGQSTRVKGRYELGCFVEDLMALLDHLGIERTHLVGFSLGGIIAQATALIYPGIIDRLVLSSTIGGVNAEDQEYLTNRYHQLLEGLTAGTASGHFGRSVSNYFSPEFIAAHPDRIARLEAEAEENDPECFAAAYRIIAETDLANYLSAVRAKTLVITGEHDRASPQMAVTIAGNIPDAKLKIFKGLRHNLMTEDPEQMASTISEFLAS
jgi:pimeloyl-ACP methyl ester carboxylesterase